MKGFLTQDFLLNTSSEKKLYHEFAKSMPIFDYHCHLSPKEIWENNPYSTVTEVWLTGDHYKWRAMRLNGVSEENITGSASNEEKFLAWARTVPKLIGNPLYHWTHMELKQFFHIDEPLTEENALDIYKACNQKLKESSLRPRGFIEKSNVKWIGTTDDPTDSLMYHDRLKNDQGFQASVLPTFRPDGALKIEKNDFSKWISKLANVTHKEIHSFQIFLTGVESRINYFDKRGCRSSDHDLTEVHYLNVTEEEAGDIFRKRLRGELLTSEEIKKYKSFLMNWLGRRYADRGWVMQLHIGVLRNNNSRMFQKLGPDTGFDSVGEVNVATALSRFLDSLDENKCLPKTVLYSVNPKDYYVIGTMLGNFTEEGVPGKVQFGSAWWFNDHIDGIKTQMKYLANLGLLSHFIGMLTDSRSLLSFPRHDYFRRILCHIVGSWMEEGHIPNDRERWGAMIQDICYYNAKRYFGIEEES